jgi:PAS domain S-box-containing protein
MIGRSAGDPMGGTGRWLRIGLAAAAISVYVFAFLPPFGVDDVNIVQLAAAPIVVCAWLFGFWGGTLAAIVVMPINAFLFSLASNQTMAQVIHAQDDLLPPVLLLVLGAVLGGLRDVADQMRREHMARTEVEEARRESEERYRFVAESASDGIVTIDQDRRILFANRAAEKMFGLTITDMVGRPFSMLIPERVRDEHETALKRYLDSVVTSHPDRALQIAGTGKGRREIALEISFGEYVKNGQPIFTGIVRDVTERKQLEQVLKRAKEDAERANRAKSDFLSRMSHELRTPLNAILGFAQLLDMDELDPEEKESVDQILKAGRHLLVLVDEVLDIARIEAGRVQLSLEPVDVADVVAEAWELVRHDATSAGIRLESGAAVCGVAVTADRQRLKQALLNLLSNAVKYNRDAGSVRVHCSAGTTGPNRVRISVTDTGRGIPEAAMDRLFVPFERLGADRSGIQGTGIGLAVSRGLVEAMDGEIGVDSVVGTGSTFWLELPLDPDQRRHDPADWVAALAARGEAPAEGGTGTILYIEDNPSNFKLIERILARRSGVTLLTAVQGELGLDLAREHEPDLVLLDLHLPDMHGSEVLRRIREDDVISRTPVVIISADATSSQASQLLDAGAQAYLPKPLDVQEFLRIVDDALLA